jgi:L-galactose dehydrogenase
MFTAGKGSGLTDAKAGDSSSEDIWFAEDSAEDKAHATEIVVACIKAGVNLIDTSHWYGQGRSERLLGTALSHVPRSAYHIMTKVGRYEKDVLSMFDFSYDKTYQAGKDSLARLRCGVIDVLQIHDPEFAPSIDVLLEQTLPALQRLKDEGVARHLGITGYPLELQQEIIARSPVALQTSLTYCHYTLSDTSLLTSGHPELCASKGMALINAAPIAMGLHSPRPAPDWHPASPVTKALCKQAASYCDEKGVSIVKLALHFTISNPAIASTLVSCTTLAELRDNLAAATLPLSSHEAVVLKHINATFFKPAGAQTWHGVELAAYWQNAGKALMLERLYSRGSRPRGLDVSAQAVRSSATLPHARPRLAAPIV